MTLKLVKTFASFLFIFVLLDAKRTLFSVEVFRVRACEFSELDVHHVWEVSIYSFFVAMLDCSFSPFLSFPIPPYKHFSLDCSAVA